MQGLLSRWASYLGIAVALVLALASPQAAAQLSIEITGAGANRIPIAIVPFPGEGALPPGITPIVIADLDRSGLFRTIKVPPIVPLPTEATPVDYAAWQARQADALVQGSVAQSSDGRYQVRFRLFDVVRQVPLGGVAYTLSKSQARATAHQISDYIFQKLTGIRGVFATRISYVVKRGPRYELQIADEDGADPETALASFEPIISPAWSPHGRRLAYVSFETKKPVVYVHDLITGQRHVLANFKGTNSAPAWAPNGQELALALSKDGGSQLFLIKPDGTDLRRITFSDAIDTEPDFSPDGKWIYFTSDRGGTPQIYRMPASGGDAQRITFQGSYNVSPHVSPDGKSLAFVTRTDAGQFRVALLDLASGQMQVLTDGNFDESPSFSPNGRMILYATVINNRGVLSAVSVDGRVKYRLTAVGGDVREPAWGPFASAGN